MRPLVKVILIHLLQPLWENCTTTEAISGKLCIQVDAACVEKRLVKEGAPHKKKALHEHLVISKVFFKRFLNLRGSWGRRRGTEEDGSPKCKVQGAETFTSITVELFHELCSLIILTLITIHEKRIPEDRCTSVVPGNRALGVEFCSVLFCSEGLHFFLLASECVGVFFFQPLGQSFPCQSDAIFKRTQALFYAT